MPQRGRKLPDEPFRRINVDEAKQMVDEGDSVVVDVRTAREWQAGHVKGAIWIIVDDIMQRIDELPRDKNLLFICAQGVRSALACEMAAAMGLDQDRLYNIEDGTQAWIDKGYPAERGS